MKRIAFLLVLFGGLAVRTALAQDELIVAGAGWVGKWDTDFELANTSAEPVDVALWIPAQPLGVPCPPNCTSWGGTIPGNGTLRVRASEFIGELYLGPQMVHVENVHGGPLPVVHARSVSSESSCQFAELPVVRRSTIAALDASTLVFPGAMRGDGFYTNLVLESLGQEATRVEVELFDADGHSFGAAPFLVPGLPTWKAFTLVDVAGFFGVTTLADGQVRVRNLTSSGPLWGVLSTVGSNGSLRVSLGANP
jgi:hypothetical protein